MNTELLLQEAEKLQPQLTEIRRSLHRHPETGFNLAYTKPFVKSQLEQMGYDVIETGKAGLVTTLTGKLPGKTILLRSDMDALPIQEEADIDYKSQYDGKMHGCGHDMHTAMLLGAAMLLKAHQDEIVGTVKLVFQPAEEIFQGAEDMIKNGMLKNPDADAAFMLHVVAGMPVPSGTVMIPGGGISMASCEQYKITVKGKSGHGSMPHTSIDVITTAAQIHLALQEINSREIAPDEYAVFTTCSFQAGNASNIFPETAQMCGTIRTLDPECKINKQIKNRMCEIVNGIAIAMRCEAQIEFYDFCPPMLIDEKLSKYTLRIMNELLGSSAIDMSLINGGKPGGGSEDFAFVSQYVPTVAAYLVAGSTHDGYIYSQHNSKVRFDDSVLYIGSAVYAYMALHYPST